MSSVFIKRLFSLLLTISFAASLWSAAHIHLAQAHDHGDGAHQHQAKVHDHIFSDHHSDAIDIAHNVDHGFDDTSIIDLDQESRVPYKNPIEDIDLTDVFIEQSAFVVYRIDNISTPYTSHSKLPWLSLRPANPRAPPATA